MAFQNAKSYRLNATDYSRKGEIDERIVELVHLINSCKSYCTTSSCSGRIIIICENQNTSDNVSNKKGCQWLYISHNAVTFEEIKSALHNAAGNAVLKFEPFVLHVQCESTDKARIMHQLAVSAGFRNSGITIGSGGKIMTAVRSTHGLEVPLTKDGRLLVSEEYIKYLVELGNAKMAENSLRIERFHHALKLHFAGEEANVKKGPTGWKKSGYTRVKNQTMKHKTTQTENHDRRSDGTVTRTCPTGTCNNSRHGQTFESPEDKSSCRTMKDGAHMDDILSDLEGISGMFGDET